VVEDFTMFDGALQGLLGCHGGYLNSSMGNGCGGVIASPRSCWNEPQFNGSGAAGWHGGALQG
ncbi:MAG: hypothetical protein L0H29_01855, partial [Sinobacteraceae bacterium]|nr:hypothetical protein [Nevskiaceae bacterium]